MSRAQLAAALTLLGFAGLAFSTFSDLRLRQDVTEFVPGNDEDAVLSRVAKDVIDSELSRTIVLSIESSDESGVAARTAAASLCSRLEELAEVEWVRCGPSPELESALYETYFPRRYAFFATSGQEASARLTDAALTEAARDLKRELSSPTAMMVRRVAPEDPLLAFVRFLRTLQSSNVGGPRVLEGQFVAPDGAALVLLGTRGSTFDSERTAPVIEAIARIENELSSASEVPLRFEQASIQRFALEAERNIRSDVQLISTLSTVFVVLLFVVLYRGPRFLVLGAIPLFTGTVAATAACRWMFDGVHGITLAFGSSLLGVGIDYVAHYINHHVLAPEPEGPQATMRKVWPGLLLGASTTIAGLAGLGWTSFPGMQEMALFAAVGITVALFSTRLLVPPFMPRRTAPPPAAAWADRVASRTMDLLRAKPRLFVAVPVAAMLIAAVGIPRLEFVDDIRAMNAADPELAAEDARVRARVGQAEAGHFVIAWGNDDQSALTNAEAAERILARAQADQLLDSYRSVTSLLRSRATHRAVERALIDAADLPVRLMRALEQEGFRSSMFEEPFRRSLVRSTPLEYEELLRSPIGTLLRPFRIQSEGRVGYLTFLSGVRNAGALHARVREHEGLVDFDQRAFLTGAYRTFRTRTMQLLAVGITLVLALCIARYRSLRLGLLSVLPALLASAVALGVLGIAGQSANLMHLVGALLSISMGEDYAVFLIESRGETREVSSTLVGIFVACITTVLSFGLLALSSHPAMRALGFTVAVGVMGSFVLSPLSLVLLGERAHPKGERR